MKSENIAVLQIIAKILNHEDIFWVLTGSTALNLRGVDVEMKDIDIMSDRENAYRIDKLFTKYCVQPMSYSETEKFRSHFGVYEINGIRIEVMADLEYKNMNGNWQKSIWDKIVKQKIDDLIVPMFTIKDELKSYEDLGREEKAMKIREFMKERK